jgi:hypothetical protein
MIGLAGLGISFLSDLIGKYGEPLIAKGIEKVTGIDVTKQELTQEDKQKIIDSQIEIMKIDFETLKLGYEDKNSARNYGVNIQISQDWLVRNAGSLIALFTILSAFVLDLILIYMVMNGTNVNPIYTLIQGAMNVRAVQVLSFYFGDSKVNADKQRLN